MEVFRVQDEIDNEANDNENFLNAQQLRDEKLQMSQIILQNIARQKK